MPGVQRMKLTALLAALALTGCGVTAREAVHRAVARWQAATNLTAPMPLVVSRWGVFVCGDLPAVTGCWDGLTIEIDMSRTDAEIARTAAHEWGHLLGAGHHIYSGVLGPKGGESSHCISAADVYEVCSNMSGCEWGRPECR
jgi:hypothetical protein